ncbi:MAG TPA: alkaline phosphatase family protein, partial [Rubrobacter sp.]|nr:alkaline phosphatase family protein [Rubrobacter sp.]
TWGERAARWAEGLRRSQDLDHWASFHDSFVAMVDLLGRVARGESPPSTVLILSGDVHHGYLTEATFTDGARSRFYQAVSSPLRNALPNKKSLLQSYAWSKPATFITRLLARLAGVAAEPLTWRMTHDAAFFDNQIATLELEDRSATITFEKAVLDASKEPALEKLYERRLA